MAIISLILSIVALILLLIGVFWLIIGIPLKYIFKKDVRLKRTVISLLISLLLFLVSGALSTYPLVNSAMMETIESAEPK